MNGEFCRKYSAQDHDGRQSCGGAIGSSTSNAPAAQSHEKLWRAYDAALAHIERLEFEFMLRAYPRWRN